MLLLIILMTISGTLSQHWPWSETFPNGSVIQSCLGSNVSLSLGLNLTSSKHLLIIEWSKEGTKLAFYFDDSFITKPAGERLEFLPNASLLLPSVTLSDSGQYEVRVTLREPYVTYSQETLLQVYEAPSTIGGSLHAYILPVGDYQAITGTWHVQLGCGKFLSLGQPAVRVVWNTPSRQKVNSTSFTNNTFILTLANPVEEGDYSCLLERTSPAAECVDSHSPLRHEATVRVHGINTRLSLIEGGLEALREETINLSRPVKDLQDVISKVVSKVKTNGDKLNSLSHETENLTSKVNYLESSNERLNGVVSDLQKESSHEQIIINNITYELQRKDGEIADEVIKLHNMTSKLQRKDSEIADEVIKLHNMTYELQAKDNDILRRASKLQIENENITGIVLELENDVKDLLRTNKNITNMFLGLEFKVKELTALDTLIKTGAARRPVSCADMRIFDNKSGIHTLYLSTFTTINVFCDQQTDNGGWTVIQRRQDGSVDFYRNWEEYEVGFGDLAGEFWIGLYNLHQLTKGQKSKLRVDLTDFDGSTAYAVYDTFYISGAADNYTLHVLGYKGNAGDSLKLHNLNQFSTYDRDNDKGNSSNCAQSWHGAWWYEACYDSNLNGRYKSDGTVGPDGVIWGRWKNDFRSFKRVEMKIKS